MPHDHDLTDDGWRRHHSSIIDFLERLIDMSATTAEVRALAVAQKATIDALGAYVVTLQSDLAAAKAAQGLSADEQADLDATADQLNTNTAAVGALVPAPAVAANTPAEGTVTVNTSAAPAA